MALTVEEWILPAILFVNLLGALGYLLAGLFVILPARRAADGEGEGRYGGRGTWALRFAVMLLCPVVGPLFFLMSYAAYRTVFRKEADLSAVTFSKERVKTCMKADERRERDIIPLEEALLVNEKRNLRGVMMSVIREDIRHSLATITLALDSGDSETSHYAAAVLSDELNKFRIYVQKLWKQMGEEEPGETGCEEILLDYMDDILRQRIFSEHEQRKFVEILTAAAESLCRKNPSGMTVKWYEEVCLRTLEIGDTDTCRTWCGRLAEQYPQELPAYTCRLKLYFACQERDAFFGTLDRLKNSGVVIDRETLELIRIFS